MKDRVPEPTTVVIESNLAEPLSGKTNSGTAPLDLSDVVQINRMLAEINAADGDEALARGDRLSAIRLYHQSLDYAANNIPLYLKLADLLVAEHGNNREAVQLIVKAIKLAPEDTELRLKFDQLRKPACRTGRRYRANLARLTDDDHLPTKISLIKLTLLILFTLITIGLPGWFASGQKIKLTPLSPLPQAQVDHFGLEFRWQSSANGINYLVQIEEHGQILLERYSRETRYQLSAVDAQLLKSGHRYHWRVLPVSHHRELLPYSVNESDFQIQK